MGYFSVSIKEIDDQEVKCIKIGKSFMGKLVYPCYAFMINDILIDTGPIVAQDKFLAFLEKNTPKHVLITHADEDHIGNLKAIQSNFDVQTYAHPKALPFMKDPSFLNLLFYQRFVWGTPEPCTAEGVSIDCPLNIDDFTFIPIETPGHRDHHLSFYLKELKSLFTGDIYCGSHIKMLFSYENFFEILESIKKLEEFNADLIFCAFRGVVDDVSFKLSEKVKFMEALQEKTITLASEGKSPKEIRKSLLGREKFISRFTQMDMCKKNMIQSILETEKERSL